MAESPSSALPGGVEWLPALGGAHLLRAEVRGDPPALVLHSADGGAHRIEPGPPARFDGTTDYLVPAGLSWSRASLVWPDGTRAVLPTQADIIRLPRRAAAPPSPPKPAALEPLPWTAPPWAGASDADLATAAWAARRETFEQELAHAAEVVARVAESERETRDAVLAIVAGTRADLQAARAAQAAEASLLSGIAEELEAERSAHAVTRGNLETLAEALAAARAELEAAREAGGDAAMLAEALAAARAELQAGDARTEREAGAPGDGTMLAEALAAARAELDAARAEAETARQSGADARAHLAGARRDAALARAQVATLRADLETERAARARAEAALRENGEGPAFLERVAALDRDVEGLRTQVRLERRAREQAEAAAAAARRPPGETGRLVADLDAAAAALRAAAEPPADSTPAAQRPADSTPAAQRPADSTPAAQPPADSTPAALPSAVAASSLLGAALPTVAASSVPGAPRPPAVASLSLPGAPWRAAEASPSPASPAVVSSSPTMYRAVAAPPRSAAVALVPAARERCLRHALLSLAQEDPLAAGTLLAGLLPAQGAVLDDTITYDLTVRGIGTFAIFLADGSARVQRTSRPRRRGEAAFHLSADPLALAELLAGQERKLRRFGRAARYSGRRKRLREIAPVAAAPLSLAEAVRAGARLEPSLVYRALPFAIPPEWTRGHVFTVAQEIVELAPRAWYVTARDGVPLRVLEHSSGAAADATVTMTRAAFDRLLRDEPMAEGERPVIRGNRAAVAALKRWTDLARGA